jgi:hypothetical protein
MPDPLDAVREAERLVREATARAEEAAREAVPPRGYEPPRTDPHPPPPPFPDLSSLTSLLDLARTSLPPDLQRQLQQALRELLIALRAVLDYSIDRLEPGAPESVQVEDIPIS